MACKKCLSDIEAAYHLGDKLLAESQKVISDAIKALEEGRFGDVRRILKTGADKPIMSTTDVAAKDGGSA